MSMTLPKPEIVIGCGSEVLSTPVGAPMFFSSTTHAYRVWSNATSWRVDIKGKKTEFCHLRVVQMGMGVSIHQIMAKEYEADLDGWIYTSKGVTIQRDPSGRAPWMATGKLELKSNFYVREVGGPSRSIIAALTVYATDTTEAWSTWSKTWNDQCVSAKLPAHRIVPVVSGRRLPEYTILV